MQNQLTITKAIQIEAKTELIFEVLSGIENWNKWTKSIQKIEIQGDKTFKIGLKAKVFQPKLFPAIWEITDINSNYSFTWITKNIGLKMTGHHTIESIANGKSVVELTMTYEGFLSKFYYKLTSSLTTKYLEMEANGLKTHCEHKHLISLFEEQ
jgi:uncharacterized membrane protein